MPCTSIHHLYIPGKKHGRWMVIGFPKKTGDFYSVKCVCTCNKVSRIRLGELRRSDNPACIKCSSKERGKKLSKSPEMVIARAVFSCIERGAKKRGLPFNISLEYFLLCAKMPCNYCGAIGSCIRKSPRFCGEFHYNGLDRLDSSLGYSEENTVPCCKACNYAKHTMSVPEFLEWASRLYMYSCSKTSIT